MLGSNQRPPPCRGGSAWSGRDRTGQEKPVDAGGSGGRPDLRLHGDTAVFDPEGRTEDAAVRVVVVGYGSRPATALTSSCSCATTRAARSASRSDASRSAASSCASSCAASAPAATRARSRARSRRVLATVRPLRRRSRNPSSGGARCVALRTRPDNELDRDAGWRPVGSTRARTWPQCARRAGQDVCSEPACSARVRDHPLAGLDDDWRFTVDSSRISPSLIASIRARASKTRGLVTSTSVIPPLGRGELMRPMVPLALSPPRGVRPSGLRCASPVLVPRRLLLVASRRIVSALVASCSLERSPHSSTASSLSAARRARSACSSLQ